MRPLHYARIVFFGDSITREGVEPDGYVTLVARALQERYPDLEIIGSGIGGNIVPNLQARLRRDVLAEDPTHVVIYIGVNDVWHQFGPGGRGGTDRELYENGLRDLVGRLQDHDVDVVLCTPAVIGEDPASDDPMNRLLEDYAGVSRRIAEETGVTLCDLRAAFVEHLEAHNPERQYQGVLTRDGVHLNAAGDRLVAQHLLKTFGV